MNELIVGQVRVGFARLKVKVLLPLANEPVGENSVLTPFSKEE